MLRRKSWQRKNQDTSVTRSGGNSTEADLSGTSASVGVGHNGKQCWASLGPFIHSGQATHPGPPGL